MRNLIIVLAVVSAGAGLGMHHFNSSTAQALAAASPKVLPLHTIGQVTRHEANFKDQMVRVRGYMLILKKGYAIFSDESGGAIGRYDLPVTGTGLSSLVTKKKYELWGKFTYGGLNSSNQNPYHLELSLSPQIVR